MTVVVLGASAGLGRALSVALARRGSNLILVARDLRDLQPICMHLSLCYRISALPVCVDASDSIALQYALRAAMDASQPISSIYLPIGESRLDDVIATRMLESTLIWSVNYQSVVAAIQTALPYLVKSGSARIVGFGSVASIRGRGRNVAYAASKRALRSYFESLRHHLSDERLVVQFYQMGYIRTQQLYGQIPLFSAISPEHAANIILDDGARDFGVRYLPSYWQAIAFLVRSLPWWMFRRLKF